MFLIYYLQLSFPDELLYIAGVMLVLYMYPYIHMHVYPLFIFYQLLAIRPKKLLDCPYWLNEKWPNIGLFHPHPLKNMGCK